MLGIINEKELSRIACTFNMVLLGYMGLQFGLFQVEILLILTVSVSYGFN
jgi:hypothetical protein